MKKKEKNMKNGCGFMGLLAILFIGLKLTCHITWSWLWVLSPLWLGFVLFIVVCIFIVVLWLILFIITYVLDKYFS